VKPTQIAACPYCGNKDTELISSPPYLTGFVMCYACMACGPEQPTEAQAVGEWNRVAQAVAYREAICDALGLDPTEEIAPGTIAAWNRVARLASDHAALEAAYSALNSQCQARIELINAIELHLDSPKWTHEEELSDDGFHIYCNGREDVRAMIADWRAKP
jgi:hypothetical protein